MRHSELHRAHRIGWLRAAVLGANGGIVSTSSLVIGVAAAHADLRREERELAENHHHEVHELKAIYIDRGLKPELAQQVAEQLMAHDALTGPEIGVKSCNQATGC